MSSGYVGQEGADPIPRIVQNLVGIHTLYPIIPSVHATHYLALLEQCSGSLSGLFVCIFTSFQCILQTAGGVMGLKGEPGYIKCFESFRDSRMRSKLLGLTNRALNSESLTGMSASLASPPVIPT